MGKTLLFYILVLLIGYLSGAMTIGFVYIANKRRLDLKQLLCELKKEGFGYRIVKQADTDTFVLELEKEGKLVTGFIDDELEGAVAQALIWIEDQKKG